MTENNGTQIPSAPKNPALACARGFLMGLMETMQAIPVTDRVDIIDELCESYCPFCGVDAEVESCECLKENFEDFTSEDDEPDEFEKEEPLF